MSRLSVAVLLTAALLVAAFATACAPESSQAQNDGVQNTVEAVQSEPAEVDEGTQEESAEASAADEGSAATETEPAAEELTNEPATSENAESQTDEPQEPQEPQEEPMLAITANGTTFTAAFEDNSSAEALIELLQEGSMTLHLHDYGDFEKVGPLGTDLPTNDTQITTVPGDVILYQGNQLTVYYDTNSWNFTRLAHIDGATREALLDAFGPGDVDITLSLA